MLRMTIFHFDANNMMVLQQKRYNMAAGTKNKPCWACHKFLPPPTAFVDFGLATGSGGGGLIGDGPDVTIIEVRCSIDSRCFSKAVVHNIATILRLIGSI